MWFTDDDSPFAPLLDGMSRRAGMDPGGADRSGMRRDAIGAFFANMRDLGAGRPSSLSEKMGTLADSRLQRQLREVQMLKAQQMMDVQRNVADIFRRGNAATQPVQMETASPGFEPGAGETLQTMPSQRDPKSLWADMYKQAGDYYASVGLTEDAKRYWDRSMQLTPTPKFSTDPKVVQTPDGPRLAVFDEQGNHKFIEGALPQRKVGREITVQGPNGPVIKLVDEEGNDIREEDGYVAPVAVNAGDRTVFTRPEAGAEVGINLSPAERENLARRDQELGISRGNLAVNQGNLGLSRERLTLERQRMADEAKRAAAGRAPDGSDLPKGYRWNAEKGVAEPIPGTKEAVERADSRAAMDARDQGAVMQADRVISKVDQALSKVGVTTAGVGGALMAKVPGSPAVNLKSDLETIKANLGFAELQAMRQASPTGGALGQVAVQELNALQSTIAALDQAQSPAQLKQRLGEVKKHYGKWKYVMEKAREQRGLPPVSSPNPGREASGPITDLRSAAQRELERRRNGGR